MLIYDIMRRRKSWMRKLDEIGCTYGYVHGNGIREGWENVDEV